MLVKNRAPNDLASQMYALVVHMNQQKIDNSWRETAEILDRLDLADRRCARCGSEAAVEDCDDDG